VTGCIIGRIRRTWFGALIGFVYAASGEVVIPVD
jgi:hypothetical protein